MQRTAKQVEITSQAIPSLLIKLTLPTIVGMLGFSIFNIVDTYYIAKIGTIELAAISFTFPVVMLIGNFNLGIATGVMSLFSRAVGKQDLQQEKQLTTASLILGVLISTIITIIGLLTIDPLFSFLGATRELLPYIRAYMKIWYIGSVFVVVPMISDFILRGLGDTKTPSFVMLTSAVINTILDPLLIFGIGPFPGMGIKGAAIATVISRMGTMLVAILIQVFREKLISFSVISLSIVIEKWKEILYIGLPNSLVKIVVPLGTGVITSILARQGHETVAGFGVALKLESFAFSAVQALSVTTAVFVGQNIGAGQIARVKKGIQTLHSYSFIYGFGILLTGIFGGRFLGNIFTDNAVIIDIVQLYLMLVPIGYGCYSVTLNNASILNVLHKPLIASTISLIQIGICNIPLAFLGAKLFGTPGVFLSIVFTYMVTSLLSQKIVSYQLSLQLYKNYNV